MNRILNAVQLGMALLLFGFSLLGVRTTLGDRFIRDILLLVGAPAVGVGTGFLVSAIVSYRLCRAWGVVKENNDSAGVKN